MWALREKKLAKVEKSKVLPKRGEKQIGEKKWKVKKEECVRKDKSFYTKKNKIKNAYFFDISIILLVYKEA